jgi:ATP diphosphatase
VDPEKALTEANRKFERRFRHVEKGVKSDGALLSDFGIDELESRWRAAKKAE